jgi:hypothetical protein
VKIEYSTNNGGTWIVVAPSVAAGTLSYSWTVPNTPSTATRVRITDAGNALVTDMSDTTFTIKQPDDADELNLPLEFALRQNYPNPFNPVTTINYEIPEDNIVTVKVYDILGAEKATLVNDFHKAGRYSITFDARQLASGVYFYTMNAGDFSSTRKFVIMK